MKHCSNVMVYVQQFVSQEQMAEAKKIVDTCKGIVLDLVR